MKLEVGQYIRTKDGIIAKCTEIKINRYMFDRIILENGYYNDWEFIDIPKEKSLIKKASNNIIDLIEVGDYVNGEKVYQENGHLFVGNWWIENKNIKSIVTKEMFESMQYKVD